MKYVLGFAFNEDLSEVLLIEKIKPDFLAGMLNGIGGKIEDGEYQLDAMVREYFEETDIMTDYKDWMTYGVFKHLGNIVENYYAVLDNKRFYSFKQKTKERLFVINLKTFREDNVNIVPNLRWLIELAIYKHKYEHGLRFIASI